MSRSIKWHEQNIIRAAKAVAVAHRKSVIVNTVIAVELLTEAFNNYEQARYESKVRQRHE